MTPAEKAWLRKCDMCGAEVWLMSLSPPDKDNKRYCYLCQQKLGIKQG